MGIDINSLKFLLTADACDFSRTVMIGRQRLYIDRPHIDRLLPPSETGDSELPGDVQYAEWVLRRLGGQVIDAIDVSDYEGASILHDLNEPLSSEYHEKYTAVIDIGTLEHLFNFPVAIRNCMDLLAVEGRMICCTVANNYCGHGFYQFSPELFFRVFQPENGFEVERMVVCDGFYESDWYEVTDPQEMKARVQVVGPYPVMLLVQARKIQTVAPFQRTPQQSDYVPAWSGDVSHADHAPQPKPRLSLRSLVPAALFRRVRAYRSARQYQTSGFKRGRSQ